MQSLNIWVSTMLWWCLAAPLAYSQSNNLSLSTPKWEFGLRSGVGFSAVHLDGNYPRSEYFVLGGNNKVLYGNTSPRAELYLGGYITRNFGPNWSLRSELSMVSKTDEGMSAALGVFPRYRLTPWLSLETGIEHRQPLSLMGRSESRFSVGAALGGKDLEFNLRFAPAFMPTTPYGRSHWLGAFQVGASYRLANVGKIFRGQK